MSTIQSIGFALLVLNTFVGMVANGFIVLFISIDWVRSRKLSPTDLILGCLALSRFLWQLIVILNSIIISFFKSIYLENYTWTTVSTMWVFSNTMNLWFGAWLSVLYLVKVANFSHHVFLQMKQRFSGLVPWLLLGSVVFSAAVALIIITVLIYVFSHCHYFQSLSRNSSDLAMQKLYFCTYSAILFVVPNIIPLMLFLVSSIFLISSLWKHLRHMEHNGIGVNDVNTQAHLTAIKALASFAILFLSSFVADFLQPVKILVCVHSWTTILFQNVSAMYPSGHAIILILINPKLKQAWVRMLYHFKYRLNEAPS